MIDANAEAVISPSAGTSETNKKALQRAGVDRSEESDESSGWLDARCKQATWVVGAEFELS
jgi:hypothetical protein